MENEIKGVPPVPYEPDSKPIAALPGNDGDLPIVHTDFGPLITSNVQDAQPREKAFLHDLRQLMERFPKEIGVARLTAKAKDGTWTAVLYANTARKT